MTIRMYYRENTHIRCHLQNKCHSEILTLSIETSEESEDVPETRARRSSAGPPEAGGLRYGDSPFKPAVDAEVEEER